MLIMPECAFDIKNFNNAVRRVCPLTLSVERGAYAYSINKVVKRPTSENHNVKM